MDKINIFKKIDTMLKEMDLRIETVDDRRPWGGFYVISEKHASKFISAFFPEEDAGRLLSGGKLSPKVLLVEPGKKLSWQYHHRRSEIWKLIEGKASVAKSHNDEEGKSKQLAVGEIIRLQQGERHRLIGEDVWGIVAEIWMHTDPENPSDEQDIIRLQDDFGR
ncbi:MAG: phosphoheptose isomerase [Chitinophagaceae bacterium]|nr:phosphoheptose isomerase [Bacteroidota bacterium]MCC6256988.1 phosphoheptose isomerase [Chitinophagaceae bacterium]MCW5916349.1 hypothetical protein [Ferruginibacter sp.]